MSNYQCEVCDEDLPCVLMVGSKSVAPVNCPYFTEETPEWKEIEREDKK